MSTPRIDSANSWRQTSPLKQFLSHLKEAAKTRRSQSETSRKTPGQAHEVSNIRLSQQVPYESDTARVDPVSQFLAGKYLPGRDWAKRSRYDPRRPADCKLLHSTNARCPRCNPHRKSTGALRRYRSKPSLGLDLSNVRNP